MQEVLVRIKRAVLAGHYVFSEKARWEMDAEGLTELDVAESVLNAVAIYKRLLRGVLCASIPRNISTSFKV